MKTAKKIISLLIVLGLLFCIIGCSEADEFEGFEPVGVRVIENMKGLQSELDITDQKTVDKLWDRFDQMSIITEREGEIGSSYIYFCFYDKTKSTLAAFTVYDNGSCCLGEDFTTFYPLNDKEAYEDFYDMYTEYANSKKDK